MERLMMGWTTTGTKEDAEYLAIGAVKAKLAACSQIDGPVTSIYLWEERIERDEEYRIVFKFPFEHAEKLERWIVDESPYDVPQWITVDATDAFSAYMEWARESCGLQ